MKQSEEKHNRERKNHPRQRGGCQVIGQANGIRMRKGTKKKQKAVTKMTKEAYVRQKTSSTSV